MRTCETCRWWKKGTRLNSQEKGFFWEAGGYDYGDCRIRAPLPIAGGEFSKTMIDDWCGEHAEKEKNDE